MTDRDNTGNIHLYNIETDGRCGVFFAPSLEEAKASAAAFWKVAVADVEELVI